jgi:hypothetical protein
MTPVLRLADLRGSALPLYLAVLLFPLLGAAFWIRWKGWFSVAREGFVLCPDCDWMRIGSRCGRELGLRRRRIVAWARRIVLALFPAIVFLGTIGLAFDRADALLVGYGLLWPLGGGVDLLFAHRLRERPPAGPAGSGDGG